jgi:hypothetical protein
MEETEFTEELKKEEINRGIAGAVTADTPASKNRRILAQCVVDNGGDIGHGRLQIVHVLPFGHHAYQVRTVSKIDNAEFVELLFAIEFAFAELARHLQR